MIYLGLNISYKVNMKLKIFFLIVIVIIFYILFIDEWCIKSTEKSYSYKLTETNLLKIDSEIREKILKDKNIYLADIRLNENNKEILFKYEKKHVKYFIHYDIEVDTETLNTIKIYKYGNTQISGIGVSLEPKKYDMYLSDFINVYQKND